ncbi:MAG TPA: hypothetical protein VJR29_08365 [bacterium]|nr:hypothetical protein [bacterium]
MGIGSAIYQALSYFLPSVFPPAPPPPTAQQLEEAANDACWQDIYSEPCARLSDLAEQSGGINVRRELTDLEARIRPLLNAIVAQQEQNGGLCTDPSATELNYTPACYSPEVGCYTALQCVDDSNDPAERSLHVFIMPEASPEPVYH